MTLKGKGKGKGKSKGKSKSKGKGKGKSKGKSKSKGKGKSKSKSKGKSKGEGEGKGKSEAGARGATARIADFPHSPKAGGCGKSKISSSTNHSATCRRAFSFRRGVWRSLAWTWI
jgi:hypothetical protein